MAKKSVVEQRLALNLILASTLAFAEGDIKKGHRYMAFALEAPDFKKTVQAMDMAASDEGDDEDDFDADNDTASDADQVSDDVGDDEEGAALAAFTRLRKSARKALASDEAPADDVEEQDPEVPDEDTEAEPAPAGEDEADESDNAETSRLARARKNIKALSKLALAEADPDVEDADGDEDDDLDDAAELSSMLGRAMSRAKAAKKSKK